MNNFLKNGLYSRWVGRLELDIFRRAFM